MRILSWNMQGQQIAAGQLKFVLNALRADVCVFQEPYAQLSVTNTVSTVGVTTRSSGDTVTISTQENTDFPRLASTWTIHHVAAGANSGAADRYAYAYRDGFMARYSLTAADPRALSEIQSNYQRQYLVVKFCKTGSSHGVRVATTHAPYNGNSGMAADYFGILLSELADGYKRSAVTRANDSIREAAKGGPDVRKVVDVLIGDLNVTDVNDITGSLGNKWVNCLNQQTGNGDKGGNLDRVIKSTSRFSDYRCGRIYMRDYGVPAIGGNDRRSGKVKDIVLPADDRYLKIMGSDHLAIYFDTDASADPDPATMQVPDQSGQPNRKPKRESPAEGFQALDFSKSRKGEPSLVIDN